MVTVCKAVMQNFLQSWNSKRRHHAPNFLFHVAVLFTQSMMKLILYVFPLHALFMQHRCQFLVRENICIAEEIDTVQLRLMLAMPKSDLGFGRVVTGTFECMHHRAGVLSQLPQKSCPPVQRITWPLSAHRNPLIIHTPMSSDHIFLGSGKNGNRRQGGAMHLNNALLFFFGMAHWKFRTNVE